MKPMQYVFNPENGQINPATEQTAAYPQLRNKVVSAELYALVCQGKVTVGDVAAMFAVGKSPEILVKNHKAIRDSAVANAPAATKTLQPEEPKSGDPDGAVASETATAGTAFDGKDLCAKKVPELLIIAASVGIDVNAEGFVPTRGNLIKAIRAKAAAAAGEIPEAEEAPVEEAPVEAPAAE